VVPRGDLGEAGEHGAQGERRRSRVVAQVKYHRN
jgi:hypothetical protein